MSNCDNLVDAESIRLMLEEVCKRDGLREFSRRHKLDPGNVSNMINNGKPIGVSVASALGFSPVRAFRRRKS